MDFVSVGAWSAVADLICHPFVKGSYHLTGSLASEQCDMGIDTQCLALVIIVSTDTMYLILTS